MHIIQLVDRCRANSQGSCHSQGRLRSRQLHCNESLHYIHKAWRVLIKLGLRQKKATHNVIQRFPRVDRVERIMHPILRRWHERRKAEPVRIHSPKAFEQSLPIWASFLMSYFNITELNGSSIGVLSPKNQNRLP